MGCHCGGEHVSSTGHELPMVISPRVSYDAVKWAYTFGEHRRNLRTIQAGLSYEVVDNGASEPIAHGSITSAFDGDKFFLNRMRHYPEVLADEPTAEALGFSQNALKNLPFVDRLSYDGEQTFQYSNGNRRGHVFLGKHSIGRNRTGIDTYFLRDPYRQTYWDEFFLAGELARAGATIPIREGQPPSYETVNGVRCLRLEVVAGTSDDHSIVTAWFDLRRGGLPLQLNHSAVRAGLDPLVVERVEDVDLSSVGGMFVPRSWKRVAFSRTENGSLQTQQTTACTVEEMHVNVAISDELFRSAIPAGEYRWREATGIVEVPQGRIDDRIPEGKRVRLENHRCGQERVSCSRSICNPGPGRPWRCVSCSGNAIVVACVAYPFLTCESISKLCGTIEVGTCNFFGTCTGKVDTRRACFVFDC